MQIYHVLYATKCLNKKETNQSYTHNHSTNRQRSTRHFRCFVLGQPGQYVINDICISHGTVATVVVNKLIIIWRVIFQHFDDQDMPDTD